MRRLFLLLLISALAIWGYVGFQLAAPYLPGGGRSGGENASGVRAGGTTLENPEELLREPPKWDSLARDPFHSFLYAEAPRPKVTVKRKPVLKALKVVSPPAAKVKGILWGENPVAILEQGGRSELLKTGGEAWDLKVTRIERHQVTVVKEDREFVLRP